MITRNDIAAQVDTAVKANGTELAEGIDIDGIVSEIVDTYGLVDIDASTEDGDPVIPADDFWALVKRHDATQADAPSVNLLSGERAEWLANLTDFRANGIKLTTRGTAVELTADALARLAEFDEHDDGYFDGESIWIGGDDYAVAQ